MPASPPPRAHRATRRDLTQQLRAADREHTTMAAAYSAAATAAQGLTTTERRALDLLQQSGPLTAGDLTDRIGLAPASVTGLIDRLERKGFAHRSPHPRDGRSITIELTPDPPTGEPPLLTAWSATLTALARDYTTEQLSTITDFLNRSSALRRDLLDASHADPPRLD
jgi:DNA-binding MarR family transcriptional regulator